MAPEQQSQDPLAGEEIDYPPDADENHNSGDAGASEVADDADDKPPPTLRLRVATWDVIGFLKDVCVGEDCGPVPYGVDMYIYPVVWGGIGAAIAAAGIGPFVSLLKGWYTSFWPVLSLALLMVSSVAGSILTMFSARYWL